MTKRTGSKAISSANDDCSTGNGNGGALLLLVGADVLPDLGLELGFGSDTAEPPSVLVLLDDASAAADTSFHGIRCLPL